MSDTYRSSVETFKEGAKFFESRVAFMYGLILAALYFIGAIVSTSLGLSVDTGSFVVLPFTLLALVVFIRVALTDERETIESFTYKEGLFPRYFKIITWIVLVGIALLPFIFFAGIIFGSLFVFGPLGVLLASIVGVVLFILTVYVGTGLALTGTAIIDRNESIQDSVELSWGSVKNHRFYLIKVYLITTALYLFTAGVLALIEVSGLSEVPLYVFTTIIVIAWQVLATSVYVKMYENLVPSSDT